MKRTLVNKMLALIGVALAVLSMTNFVAQVDDIASPRSIIHDRRFIAAMNDISDLVPADSVIVVSTDAPFVEYFTGRSAKVPFGVYSKTSLIEYMRKNHYDYLVVFEGRSQVDELKSLFSSQEIESLDESFQLERSFQTDFSRIHLYKIRDSA